jgi:hypothetical protein
MNARLNREQDVVSDAEIVSDADVVEAERLDPLFAPHLADDFRARWRTVQSGFVDDPRQAVVQGDELVAQVLKGLTQSFDAERDKLEKELSRTGDASTETLRLALRRYRSLFERLLAV